jgi:hypothetical protein
VSVVRTWLVSLEQRLPELTRRERTTAWVVALTIAATRLLAVSRTIWDWDEALFLLGMRDFNVAQHHPHPPGFPLFIVAGRMVRMIVADDFRSLQVVATVASMLLFPAIFLLARELRTGFTIAMVAGALTAFFPNVWLYGGAALSDVPTLTLSAAAAAMLLRSVRSRGSIAIAALLAVGAAGMRPQTLSVIALPLLVLVVARWKRGMVAALVIMMLTAACYAGAAVVTGVDAYRAAVASHGAYISSTDSFLNAQRPSLVRLADDFWIRPFRHAALNVMLALLSVAGLIRCALRRNVAILVAIAMFLPFAMFAWLFLDLNSVGRFSVAYMPMFAFAAAEGAASFGRRGQVAVVATFVAISATWLLPGLRVVRTQASPPVAALDSAWRNNVTVYLDRRLGAFAAALHPDQPFVEAGEGVIPAAWTEGEAAAVIEGSVPGARVFSRVHHALWDVARRRYFEVSVMKPLPRVTFGDGWYAQEGTGGDARRWMSRQSTLQLPALPGSARLQLSLLVTTPGQRVDVLADGRLLHGTIATGRYLDLDLVIPSNGRAVTLTVRTDRAAEQRADSRELALRLENLTWATRP